VTCDLWAPPNGDHLFTCGAIFRPPHRSFSISLKSSSVPKPSHIPWYVPFKILERFISARVDPIIDPLLLREQAGFRHGRSTVDQVTLLTQDIEDSFSSKKKAGTVFVDLTPGATVWHPKPHLQAAEIAA